MNPYFEINKNGHNIRCKAYCEGRTSVKKAVISVHGFCGHKDNKAAEHLAERILSKYKNVGVITFDLPCHGDDVKKKLSLQDCDTYITYVLEAVKEKFSTEEFDAYSVSFGGYLTLKYLLEHGNPFNKIVLRSPAVDIGNVLLQNIMTPEEHEEILKGKNVPVGFDRKVPVCSSFLQELQEADILQKEFIDFADDILIIHGTSDEIIPMQTVRNFAENSLIDLVEIEGADHRFRDPLKMDQAVKEMLAFWKL